jgi:hypothetical protein
MRGATLRQTITPDTFAVHPALLGVPLARPSRRLAAMLLDLLLVAILVNTGGAFLLGISAAAVFFRFATRLTGEGRGPLGRGARLLFRGAGALLLFIVALNAARATYRWTEARVTRSEAPAPRAAAASAGSHRAPDAPSDAPPAGPVSPDSLVLAYATALEARDSAALPPLRAAAASALARDSLDALAARLERSRAAERRLRESREPGFLAWLTGFLDEMGIGLGWTGLYFTAFVALWKGRTPGKRLLGIRIVRLNGLPMTFWMSFERFGGYAAGLVTGLLGFAQVYWDPNRQMIHDKIVETVVVRERRGARTAIAAAAAAPGPDRRATGPTA